MSILREALEFYLLHLKQTLWHANAGLDAKRVTELEGKIKSVEAILNL